MLIKVKCNCGSCIPIDAYRHATTIADRKCRKCGIRWRMVITPKIGNGMVMHIVDAVTLPR